MLHSIPTEKHGPLGQPMADAVQMCVHCGFCLSACPTYREFGQEMDTPRGRIVLMKQVLEGTLPWEDAQPHIDRCLGCLACEPACPSGVPYRDLISPFRVAAKQHVKRSFAARLRHALASATIPYPSRFRFAAALGRIGKTVWFLVPGALRPMLDLLPDKLPPKRPCQPLTPARGKKRATVALLTSCAQQALNPDIDHATIEVLARNGVEVIVPPQQSCCGGLAWHTGDLAAARNFARRNLEVFPNDVDAIITNAAGCGSAMHEYHLILRGTTDEARANAFRERVMDVSVFLTRLGLSERPQASSAANDNSQVVAYHDACHLANAQGVRDAPRSLLRAVPGLELRELADAHLCCGSAGTYNIDQPETAASLGGQKAAAVVATGATVVASGNIGCLTQLQVHLEHHGSPIRVRHTVQVLRDAYRAGEKS